MFGKRRKGKEATAEEKLEKRLLAEIDKRHAILLRRIKRLEAIVSSEVHAEF